LIVTVVMAHVAQPASLGKPILVGTVTTPAPHHARLAIVVMMVVVALVGVLRVKVVMATHAKIFILAIKDVIGMS